MKLDKLDWKPWPWFDDEMLQASLKVLKSGKVNYWTGDVVNLKDGTQVRGETGLFEYEFAKYHQVKYAVSLANGTMALELALRIFDIGFEDEVITTSRSFIATASACITQGAKPVFVDIECNSQNLSARTIEPHINRNTKAVIAVHLAGLACEMDEIINLLDEKSKEFGHKIILIEDCAQSLGGEYKGQKLGTIGDAGCFSFCQDKIITTAGEGGMLILKDPNAYRKAWSFKDHGKDFDRYNKHLGHPLVDNSNVDITSYYTSLGTNMRMTEVQAAIGRIALKKIDTWNISKRRLHAKKLDESFSEIEGLIVFSEPNYAYHAYYKYYTFIDLDKLKEGWSRHGIIDAINEEGIPCQFGSTWGLGREKAWGRVKMPNGEMINLKLRENFPNDKWVGQRSLMFQIHPTLEDEHIHATIDAVKKVLGKAIK